MKRTLCLILSLSMLLSLCACGNGNAGADSSSSKDSSSSETGNSTDLSKGSSSETDGSTGAGIEVDSGLFNVTITIPADFLGEDVTQEQLDEQAKEAGYKSIVLNEDGSATYVMTKAQHREMMDGIRQSIDESLKEMENSETYPDLVSATANSDYTQFVITLDAEEVSAEYAFLPMGFYIFSGMYHAFNGTQPENINIQFVSAKTGEVLEESNSSEME